MIQGETVAAVKRAATMKTGGGTVLERVEALCSTLEDHFNTHPQSEAKFRAADGSYTPGNWDAISEALVDGITPDAFKNSVLTGLAGSYRLAPIP